MFYNNFSYIFFNFYFFIILKPISFRLSGILSKSSPSLILIVMFHFFNFSKAILAFTKVIGHLYFVKSKNIILVKIYNR